MSFDQTSKDPFYRKLYSRITRNNVKSERKKEISSYLEKATHSFYLYPYYLWIGGGIFTIFSIFFTILIYISFESQTKSGIIANIIAYYIGFYLLYSGKIERFTINRKKGLIKLSKTNIFCSKVEKVIKFDDIDYIEIVIQGMKKGADDHRKYFIRIYHKERGVKPLQFGYTWDFEKIKYKYQVCLAMIKGIVHMKVDDSYIKDESTYFDYVY